MSLINEALKRVTASKPPDAESYRITSQPQTNPNRSRMVIWIAAVVGVIVVAIVCFVAYRLLNNAPAPSDVTEAKHVLPPATAPVVTNEAPSASVTSAKTAAVASNEEQTVDSDSTPVTEPDPDPPMPVVVVVPEPPKLVLQGITTDSLDREALINGAVLKIGEEFLGATVVSIENRVVRLKFGQKEIVLRMP